MCEKIFRKGLFGRTVFDEKSELVSKQRSFHDSKSLFYNGKLVSVKCLVSRKRKFLLKNESSLRESILVSKKLNYLWQMKFGFQKAKTVLENRRQYPESESGFRKHSGDYEFLLLI
jgi:hypothetical protein